MEAVPESGRACAAFSCFAVPIPQIPEIVVPSADRRMQLVGDGLHLRTLNNRDDRVIAAHQVVHTNEQGRALDRVELAFGRSKCPVVLLVAPTRDVATLPFVLLGSDLPRD